MLTLVGCNMRCFLLWDYVLFFYSLSHSVGSVISLCLPVKTHCSSRVSRVNMHQAFVTLDENDAFHARLSDVSLLTGVDSAGQE